jgi:hypothetical protein
MFQRLGIPCTAVNSHEEAVFISTKILKRRELEHALSMKELSEKEHDLKSVHGLFFSERSRIYSGDKTPYYERLGLIEESDLEKYGGK